MDSIHRHVVFHFLDLDDEAYGGRRNTNSKRNLDSAYSPVSS